MRQRLVAMVVWALLPATAWGAVQVILVRHAEVAGPGSDPSLSAQGKARAELLASMLRDLRLEAIYVSEFARTQQTARPSAEQFHLPPQKLEPEALRDAIRARTSGTVLVVGHSNTVPRIVALLGGPEVHIGATEYDHLFVLTVGSAETTILQLRYGSSAPSPPAGGMAGLGMLNERSPVVQITFVRSGGFAGAARQPVRGTIELKDDQADVSAEGGYHRSLAPEETAQLRAGAADPSALDKAKHQIGARTRGAGDLDNYLITVKTKDGKTHNVSLNTSGSSTELQDVSPAVAQLLRWLRDETKKIQAQRTGGQ